MEHIDGKIGKQPKRKMQVLLLFGCLQDRKLYHVGEGLREPVEIRLVLPRAL
jgi:hypothetical protein